MADEIGWILRPFDDIYLFSSKFVHNGPNPRSLRPNAGPLGVDVLVTGGHCDLGTVPRLSGNLANLDDLISDLRNLELEQFADEVGVRARANDLRPPGGTPYFHDVSLDPAAVVVALAWNLFGLRQQRLDSFSEIEKHVPWIRLLNDGSDYVAFPAGILSISNLTLGISQPLKDHLFGSLSGDASEILRVDLPLLRDRSLLGLFVLLNLLGVDLHIACLPANINARVITLGFRHPPVRGGECLLERRHDALERDALLALHQAKRIKINRIHFPSLMPFSSLLQSTWRLAFIMDEYGISTRIPSSEEITKVSSFDETISP